MFFSNLVYVKFIDFKEKKSIIDSKIVFFEHKCDFRGLNDAKLV